MSINTAGICEFCGLHVPPDCIHTCAGTPTRPDYRPFEGLPVVYGWICARCGRSNSPAILICSCPPLTITTSSTEPKP
jgi:hypothetical protein